MDSLLTAALAFAAGQMLGLASNGFMEWIFHRRTRALLSAEIARGHVEAERRKSEIVEEIKAAIPVSPEVPSTEEIVEAVKAAISDHAPKVLRGGHDPRALREMRKQKDQFDAAAGIEQVTRALAAAIGDDARAEAIIDKASQTVPGRAALQLALAQASDPSSVLNLLGRYVTREAGGISQSTASRFDK